LRNAGTSGVTPRHATGSASPGETPTNPGHVGMYIGDGLVVEAPETGLNIMITPLKDYWSQNTVAMRRVV
jgi:cell wall-associated NlpC family hydrolase